MCRNLYVTYIFKTSVYFCAKDSFHITNRSQWIYIASIATVYTGIMASLWIKSSGICEIRKVNRYESDFCAFLCKKYRKLHNSLIIGVVNDSVYKDLHIKS